jgi:hypothetical protein
VAEVVGVVEAVAREIEHLLEAQLLLPHRRHVDGFRALRCLVRFDTARSDTELAAILATLVGLKIDVSQFREIPKDLEDAFLSVTRREAPAT